MLNRLAGPTNKADKLMKSLGVTTKDASGNMLNIVDIMAQVAKQTEKMGNADQLAAYKEIFGEEAASGWPSSSAKPGPAASPNAAMIRQQSKGVIKEMAAVMGDNARGDLDNMTSAMEDLNIQMLETQNGPTARPDPTGDQHDPATLAPGCEPTLNSPPPSPKWPPSPPSPLPVAVACCSVLGPGHVEICAPSRSGSGIMLDQQGATADPNNGAQQPHGRPASWLNGLPHPHHPIGWIIAKGGHCMNPC